MEEIQGRKRDSWDLRGFEEMYGEDPSPEGRGWREAPGEGYLISYRARL
jgi:hypothetical protein